MSIASIFFICLAVFVIAVVAALLNFFVMSKSMFNSVRSMDMNSGFGSMKRGVGLHIIFAGFASLSALASLITGIIWLVQTFKGV